MMYNLKAQQFDNTFDVMVYTMTSMKECGYSAGEIDDYIADAISSHNAHLIDVSLDVLDECNKVFQPDDKVYTDTWRDFYYKDDCSYSDSLEDEEDDCFYFDSFSDKPKHFWEDDNVLDDIESSDEFEAYEGFDCCKNRQYYWDDPDKLDDEDDSESEEDTYDYLNNWKRV